MKEASCSPYPMSVATLLPPLLWAGPGHRPDRRLLRDLPDVAAGIAEAGAAHAPWPIQRAVQQVHSACGQLRAHRTDAIHVDIRRLARPPARPLLRGHTENIT